MTTINRRTPPSLDATSCASQAWERWRWGLGVGDAASGAPSASQAAAQSANRVGNGTGPYNILFILTDQERFFRPGELPANYVLPAHERLMAHGRPS